MFLTVHSGPNIPIHVVTTREADHFYETHIGKEILGVRKYGTFLLQTFFFDNIEICLLLFFSFMKKFLNALVLSTELY